MGLKRVVNLPKCDFCDRDAKYDAPTLLGPWAYMCEKCSQGQTDIRNAGICTEFVKHTPTEKKTVPQVLRGIEKTQLIQSMQSDNRYVACPNCGFEHHLEIDASGMMES